MSSRGLQPISVRHLPARLSPSSGRRSAGGMRHIWSFGWHGCGWSRGGRRSHTTRGASWVGGHWKRRATGHLLILDVDGRLAPNVCQPHHTTDRAEPTLPPRLVGLHHRTQPLVRPRALARQRISDVAGGRLRRRAITGLRFNCWPVPKLGAVVRQAMPTLLRLHARLAVRRSTPRFARAK